jgi:hypothetical protein
MLNKSSLVATQKQLTNSFGDSKYDSPATSRNSTTKHINNNHESNKITKHKKKITNMKTPCLGILNH